VGNLHEFGLKKLVLYLKSRTLKKTLLHPKVTMKKISGVVLDYNNVKKWLERNKKKQVVQNYLCFEKCTLGFFDSVGNYYVEVWKVFKKIYNITKAMENVLLIAVKEVFIF